MKNISLFSLQLPKVSVIFLYLFSRCVFVLFFIFVSGPLLWTFCTSWTEEVERLYYYQLLSSHCRTKASIHSFHTCLLRIATNPCNGCLVRHTIPKSGLKKCIRVPELGVLRCSDLLVHRFAVNFFLKNFKKKETHKKIP